MSLKLQKLYSSKIVTIFYILLPIIEVITTFMVMKLNSNITLGAIYKGIFTVYAVIYMLFLSKSHKNMAKIFLGLIFLYCVTSFFVTLADFSFSSILDRIVLLSRYICFPVITLFMYIYIKDGNNISLKSIVYSAGIYGLFMLLAGITGTAIPSYHEMLEYGHSGWFYSGNEISNLLSMFYPIIIYYVARDKTALPILSLGLVVYGLMVVGTKTSLFAIVIVTLTLLIFSLLVYIFKRSIISKRILIITGLLAIFYIFTVKYTPAYKFMMIRYDEAQVENQVTSSTTTNVDKFIFNGREKDMVIQTKMFEESNTLEKLFGLSDDTKVLTKNGEFNVIERDFYDVLFIHGIVGIIIFFLPVVIVLSLFIKHVIFNFKREVDNYKCAIGASAAIATGISFIAGHVFLATTVAIFLSLILAKLSLKEEKRFTKHSMIIYMPKLAAGGMEISLINFLNVTGLKKILDITLVVGYVENPEYIDMLPVDINLRVMRKGKFNKIGKVICALKYPLEIFRCMDRNYDVAVCYSYHHKVLSILTRLASKNTILFMHTDLINSRTKEEIDRLNKKVEFEEFKSIVCVSNAAKNAMLKLYPEYKGHIIVANNYIDGEKILKLANEEKIEKEEVPCFINVSRHFERAKKITRIIEAAKKLKEEGYNFKVWLVGDGEDTEEYINKIKEYNLEHMILLKGRQTNPYKYINAANCLVVSSDFEGYGMVIDEARVLNKPVISTDVADADIIVKEGFGILASNSLDGVYTAMKEFLDKGYEIENKFSYVDFNKEIDNRLLNLLELIGVYSKEE